MKKAIAVLFLASLAATAGPLKVASFPFRHNPLKAVEKGAAHVVYAVGKALLW